MNLRWFLFTISKYTYITRVGPESGSAWIRNFCLDPELGKFIAGHVSGINYSGSTTLNSGCQQTSNRSSLPLSNEHTSYCPTLSAAPDAPSCKLLTHYAAQCNLYLKHLHVEGPALNVEGPEDDPGSGPGQQLAQK